MRLFLAASLAVILFVVPSRADEKDAKAILDKAINALGGAEKLNKVKAFSWKSKGTITFNDNENEFTGEVTIKGLDQYRREFGNDQFSGVVVVDGNKGWRKFGDNSTELEGDGLANEKRAIYLNVIPITLVPLNGNGFKFEAAGEEKVADKPANVLKVTGPDGKDFKLYFDKESGLPAKLVAQVLSFQGDEYTSETTYSNYKDFGGIKKATKLEIKRDGNPFQSWEITEFKILDKVEPDTFTEPK
jgi:outer membrane lipoprotein-sorting protein